MIKIKSEMSKVENMFDYFLFLLKVPEILKNV